MNLKLPPTGFFMAEYQATNERYESTQAQNYWEASDYVDPFAGQISKGLHGIHRRPHQATGLLQLVQPSKHISLAELSSLWASSIIRKQKKAEKISGFCFLETGDRHIAY